MMYEYFASYIKQGRTSSQWTFSNAVFGSNHPLSGELIREFEKHTIETEKCKNCLVLNIQLLRKEDD